jgi:hypothetical protein
MHQLAKIPRIGNQDRMLHSQKKDSPNDGSDLSCEQAFLKNYRFPALMTSIFRLDKEGEKRKAKPFRNSNAERRKPVSGGHRPPLQQRFDTL